jgi:RNA polymerase sigma-70 factor (ECF subfamily)
MHRHAEQSTLDAFKQIYEANISLLVRFAQRFTEAEVAEDIVHDVFAELWKSEKQLDDATARAYLFMAVRNRCINHLKQEHAHKTHLRKVLTEIQLHGLDYFDSTEKLIIEAEQLQQIYSHVDQLPEQCRRIFKLAYFDGKKSTEIAELLTLSIRTVEHQLYLGLKTLRIRLTRH